jgi:hypothetical protein
MNNREQITLGSLFLSVVVMLVLSLLCFYLFALLSINLLFSIVDVNIFEPPTLKEKIVIAILVFSNSTISSIFSNWVGLKMLKYPNIFVIKLFIFLQVCVAIILLLFDINLILNSSALEIISYVVGSVISISISFCISRFFLPKN